MPHVSPPPPYGTTTASTSGRSSRISSPIVPLPAITAGSLNACTNRPLEAVVLPRPEDLPPLVERHRDDLRPQAPNRGQLRLRSRVRDDARAADAETSRPPGDALSHVAGARGPDAAARAPRVRRARARFRSAQLEGADRLEVLELEVDLRGRVVELEPDERRADDCSRRDARGRPRSRPAGSQLDLGPDALLARPAVDEPGGSRVLDRVTHRLVDGDLLRRAFAPRACLRAPRPARRPTPGRGPGARERRPGTARRRRATRRRAGPRSPSPGRARAPRATPRPT